MSSEPNPTFVEFRGRRVRPEELTARLEALEREVEQLRTERKGALEKHRRKQALKPFEAELIKLQEHLERHELRMVILFEGRDAAGKGGAIRRVTHYMNPRHYRVVALGRPTEAQRSQWYFQKYVAQLPRGGEMVLFDRSWYNRAMVEPVFGFCTPEEHRNFMQGVVGFERDLVRQGTILVKFYFSVGKEEQRRRFEERRTDPLKQWKLSEIDVQAQERWDDFTRVKRRMLEQTHTLHAPWTVIRADDKPLARLNAIKVILNSVDYDGRNRHLNYIPDPEIVISGSRELELMKLEEPTGG
jgi:polyphosphate kinase 2